MSDCPFCGNDPYHYVDNGVGWERVAVVCCGAGIALIQYGDQKLSRMVSLSISADQRRARHGNRLIAKTRERMLA